MPQATATQTPELILVTDAAWSGIPDNDRYLLEAMAAAGTLTLIDLRLAFRYGMVAGGNRMANRLLRVVEADRG